MQPLQPASDAADVCARELLDTVPMVMRIIRAYMRGHRSGLTVPQFRTLCYLDSSTGSTLSEVADFIGLSLPAMSRLVDGLVEKGLMKRRSCDDDRRHVRLSVTPTGQAAIRGARALAQARLAEVVGRLKPQQQNAVVSTMRMVREIFTLESAADDETQRGSGGRRKESAVLSTRS
jgi:MarR family transcriptional regulator for hemolysin